MATKAIDELIEQGRDDLGRPVRGIYARHGSRYVVYQTPDRVDVQFADSSDLAAVQQSDLAKLGPLRGQINGLLADWRGPTDQIGRPPLLRRILRPAEAKAGAYDRRVADALVLGLEGDPYDAKAILGEILEEIRRARDTEDRSKYLLTALAMGAGAAGSISLAIVEWGARLVEADVWMGAAAGAVGAFASIAQAITRRHVMSDWGASEGALRVLIGAICGAVFVGFLDSAKGLLPASLNGDLEILLAFAAGFAERLVPDISGRPQGELYRLSWPARLASAFRRTIGEAKNAREAAMPELRFQEGKPAGFDEAHTLAMRLAADDSLHVQQALDTVNAMLATNQAICTRQMPAAAIDAIQRGGVIVYRCRHAPSPHEF